VAKDCVMALLDNLQPNDAFGLVVFDDVSTHAHKRTAHVLRMRSPTRAHMCVLVQEMDVVQEMQLVSALDMAALKADVTKLRPRWCTNMLRGFRGGVQLITQYNARTAEARARPAQRFKQFFSDLIAISKPRAHSKRIMFLTDACVRSPQLATPNSCSFSCVCCVCCVCVCVCAVCGCVWCVCVARTAKWWG
jgi:hypothetical protein